MSENNRRYIDDYATKIFKKKKSSDPCMPGTVRVTNLNNVLFSFIDRKKNNEL